MSEKKDPLEDFHPLPPKIVPEMTAGQAKAYAEQVGSGLKKSEKPKKKK